jgi:hypothetical protein
MEELEVKNLFDQEPFKEMLDRASKLSADSKPLWGKMNVAQMFAHCAEVQEVMNGKDFKAPWYMKLFSGFIKKMVINRKPYQKNLPTAPQYVKDTDHDFDTEKARFIEAITFFHNSQGEGLPQHPVFGKMTDLEKGWAMYKHHTHHLTQFGV